MNQEIMVLISVLIAIVTGLGEAFKVAGFPVKLIPITSVVLGVAAGVFLVFPDNLNYGIVTGLVIGLSSVGLFSSVKNISESVKKDNKDN